MVGSCSHSIYAGHLLMKLAEEDVECHWGHVEVFRTGTLMRLSGPLRQGRSVVHVKMLALMASLVATSPLHRHVVAVSVWMIPLWSPVLN